MSENAAPLERDMIAQPELWRLAMLAGPRRLDVCLMPPVSTEAMIYRSILLDAEAPTATKALEDAVYANPLLLSDFRKPVCLIDTPQTLIVPAGVDPADHELLLRRAFALDEADPVVSPTADPDAVILTAVDPEVRGFFSRTFFNVSFASHLAPLCALTPDAADGGAVNALCRHDSLDVVVFGDNGRLLAANTFEAPAAADAAYYILALRQVLQLDRPTVSIGGDAAPAAALIAELSRFDAVAPRQLELPPLKFKIPAQGADYPVQLTLTSDNAHHQR